MNQSSSAPKKPSDSRQSYVQERWDQSTPEGREQALLAAGPVFRDVLSRGQLNPSSKRLLDLPWERIIPALRTILAGPLSEHFRRRVQLASAAPAAAPAVVVAPVPPAAPAAAPAVVVAPTVVDAVDYKGFTRVDDESGLIHLRGGNLDVLVRSMGSGKYQAAIGGARSTPHLPDMQAAVNWAEAYRRESERLAGLSEARGPRPEPVPFHRLTSDEQRARMASDKAAVADEHVVEFFGVWEKATADYQAAGYVVAGIVPGVGEVYAARGGYEILGGQGGVGTSVPATPTQADEIEDAVRSGHVTVAVFKRWGNGADGKEVQRLHTASGSFKPFSYVFSLPSRTDSSGQAPAPESAPQDGPGALVAAGFTKIDPYTFVSKVLSEDGKKNIRFNIRTRHGKEGYAASMSVSFPGSGVTGAGEQIGNFKTVGEVLAAVEERRLAVMQPAPNPAPAAPALEDKILADFVVSALPRLYEGWARVEGNPQLVEQAFDNWWREAGRGYAGVAPLLQLMQAKGRAMDGAYLEIEISVDRLMKEAQKVSDAEDARAAQEFRDQVAAAEAGRLLAPEVAQSGADPEGPPLSSPAVPVGTSRPVIFLPPQDVTFRRRNEGAPVYGKTLSRPEDLGIEVFAGMTRGEAVEYAIDHGWVASKIVEGRNDTFTRDSLESRRAQMTRAYRTDTPEFKELERRLASIDAGLEARTTYKMTSPEGVTVPISKRLYDYFVKIDNLEGKGQVREQAKAQSSEVLVGDSEAGWPGLTFSLDRPFGRFFWKGREIDPVLLVPEYAGRTYPFQEEIPEGGNQALPGAVILEVRRIARERAQWFAAQDSSFVWLPATPDDDIDLELARLDAGNESESAELRARLGERVRRAFEVAGGSGALNVIQVNQSQAMAGAIADADGSMLRRLLHAENSTARAAFSSLTGLDLGSTARAASEVVDSFCAGIRKGRVHQWGLGWSMEARAERDDVGQGQFDSRAAEILASDQVFFARAVALQYLSRERAHEDARRMAMQVVFPLDQDLVSLPDGRFIVRRKGAGVYISATGERFAVEPTSSGGVVIDLAPKTSPDRIPQEFDDLAAAVLWMDSADEHREEMQRAQRARMAKESESAAEAAAVAARIAAEERSLLGGVGLVDILGMDVAVSEAEGDSAKLIRRRQKVSAADFELAVRRAIDTRDATGLSGYADTYPLAVERLRSALSAAEKAPAPTGVPLTIREGASPDSFDVFESALVVAQFSARDGVLDASSVRHIDPNHDRTTHVEAEIDRFVGEMERADSVDMAAVQVQIGLIGARWENIRARLSVALETLRDAHFELTALAQRGNMSVLAGDIKARESQPQGLRTAETTIATFRHFAANQPVPVDADLLLEYLGGVPDIDAIRELAANPDGGPDHPGGPGGRSKKGGDSRSDEVDAAPDDAGVAEESSGDRPSMAMAGDGWASFLAGDDGAVAGSYDARHVAGDDAIAVPADPTAEPAPELDRPAVTRFSVYRKGPGVIELSGRDDLAISWSERTALVGWARRQGLVSRSVASGPGFALEIRGSQALLDQVGVDMPLSGEQSKELMLLQSTREGRWWSKVFSGVDVDPAASLAALRFISGRDASFAGAVDDAWIPALSAAIESDGTPLTSAEIMHLAKASFESVAGSEAEGLVDVGGGVLPLSSQESRGNHGNESGQGEADPGVGGEGRGLPSEGQGDGSAGGVDREPVDAGLAGASQGSAGGGSVSRAAEGPGGAGVAGPGGRDVEEHGGARDTAGAGDTPGAAVAADEGLISEGSAAAFGRESASQKLYLVTQRVDFGDLMRLSGLDPLDTQAFSADRVADVARINPDFGFQVRDAALGVFCLPVELPEQIARRFGLRRVLDGDLAATRQRAEVIFSNMIPNIEGYAELSEKEFEDSVRNWLAAGEWQYSAASALWLPRLAAEVRARVDGHLEAERVYAPRQSLGADASRAQRKALAEAHNHPNAKNWLSADYARLEVIRRATEDDVLQMRSSLRLEDRVLRDECWIGQKADGKFRVFSLDHVGGQGLFDTAEQAQEWVRALDGSPLKVIESPYGKIPLQGDAATLGQWFEDLRWMHREMCWRMKDAAGSSAPAEAADAARESVREIEDRMAHAALALVWQAEQAYQVTKAKRDLLSLQAFSSVETTAAEAAQQLVGVEVELTLADIERDLLLHADDADEMLRLKLKRQAVLSEQGRVASRALLEQPARELKGFAYSISDLFGDGVGKRLVGRLGKSERDTLLMERFGVSREHAHEVNNLLDGERPVEVSKEVAERLMKEYPAVGAMVAEAQSQTEESSRLYAKQVADAAQKEILTFRDDAPEVAQPMRVGGGAITIQAFTLSGPRSTRANLYEVPGHRGVQLAVHEYRSRVSGEIGYRVYLPASGQLVEDSNGVSSLSDVLEAAALRIRNRRHQILAKAAMDAVRAQVDAARDSGPVAAADQSAPAELPAGQPEAAAAPPAAPAAAPEVASPAVVDDLPVAPSAPAAPSPYRAQMGRKWKAWDRNKDAVGEAQVVDVTLSIDRGDGRFSTISVQQFDNLLAGNAMRAAGATRAEIEAAAKEMQPNDAAIDNAESYIGQGWESDGREFKVISVSLAIQYPDSGNSKTLIPIGDIEAEVERSERDAVSSLEFKQGEDRRTAQEQARVEANRGLTISQRKANAHLDEPVIRRLGPASGNTRRQALEAAVRLGATVEELQVPDPGAKERKAEDFKRMQLRVLQGRLPRTDPEYVDLLEKFSGGKPFTKTQYSLSFPGDDEYSVIGKLEFECATDLISRRDALGSAEKMPDAADVAPVADDRPRLEKRNIWLPKMTVGRLEALMSKVSHSADDIEDLRDFKYFLLEMPEDAEEKGFMHNRVANGGIVSIFKDKFWLINIDSILAANGASYFAKNASAAPAAVIPPKDTADHSQVTSAPVVAPTSVAPPVRPRGVESSLREDRSPAPEADHKPSSPPAAPEVIAHAEPASPVQPADEGHVISDDDRLGEGGQRAKFRANIEAIRILKRSPKQVLSAADRKALAAYVGWGGLKGVFDPQNKQWESERTELRALLTPQEWESASRSQLNAHYTSREVVDAMYAAISRVGFTAGRIMEPSVGTGNFFGRMPKEMRNHPGTRLMAVELDLLTSQIAKELYPNAKVIGDTGFQDVKIADGYFDLTVGNPPFGSEPLSDDEGSEYNGWSIHNYFFAKSIEKTRPGGLVSMVVSHTLMDRLSPKMREWMAERVDLVDAVRLPNTAFLGNAGTQVVTDILIFQRKERDGHSEGAPVWTKTQTKTVIDEKGRSFEAEVNAFFVANPEKVLGREAATGSMYRAGEYTVEPADDWKERLADWAKNVPEGVYNNVNRSSDPRPGESGDIDVPAHVKPGHYFLDASAAVRVRLEDSIGQASSVPWDPPNARSVDRMRSMILLRELLRHQMLLERSKFASSQEIESHRSALAAGYDLFLKNFGHLNSRVNRRIFGDDLDSHLLQALEFDYDPGVSVATARDREIEPREPSAKRADILSRRVLFPRTSVEEVASARDALLVCLDENGMVDLPFMQQIYPGHSEQQIVEELGDLLFQDPVTSGYKTRDEYLAGDVKTKLEEARRALSTGGRAFERNVAELEAVQPADLPPSRIHASLGASWIPTRIFHEFIAHVTESPPSGVNAVFVPALARWSIQPSSTYSAAKARGEFGTPAMSAFEIIESLSSNRAIEVKRKDPVTDKYVTDIDQTEAARAKADLLRAEWQRWLWSDADRAAGLAEIYNKEFNRTIKRKYDGQHLKLHGSSAAIELIAHQKAGVWRGVQERRLLLDQVVGAGKTYEMAATSQEMRRLGMCSKPLFAVPNHLTLQWRDEFARLYPGANVLAATPEDFEGDNRRKLFAKIATGRWDAVIVGHSSLKKLAIPIDDEIEMLQEEVDEISNAIKEMKSARGDRHIERDMQRIKARLEEKLKGLIDRSKKDRGVDFQDLGIDALFVDELHEFKNLAYQTRMNRVAGLGNPEGSEKARDLYMKVRWMQRAFGDRAILVGGTGTPVSNSLSEMYTMQKFFCTPEMIADGTFHFDNWARLFGEVSSVYEVSPTGSGYRLSERFSKFKNLPLLMGRYAAMAETTTLDDLKKQEEDKGRRFPVPRVAGGKPTNIVADRSPLQRDFFGVPQLDRADNGTIQFGMGDVGGVLARFIPAEAGGNKTPEGWIMARDERSTSNLLPRRYPTKEEAEAAFVQEAVTPKTFIPRDSLLGQFSRLAELSRESKGKINALSLTSAANKASLDYRLIDPSAPDFPDSKINIAVDRLMGRYEKWMKDKGTQLIFCDLSVPKSAKGSMGGKPKRVYVRNDKDGGDALGHASGTLHLIDGHSDLTYFLVKGSSGGMDAYDTHTGAILQRNCGVNRQEAIATLSRFANDPEQGEANRQRWMAMRLAKPLIEDEEIAEYIDKSGIEVDPEGNDAYLLSDAMALSSIASGFSVYDDMRAKLIARGVPPREIEFIHDHDTPVKKQKLFQRVRSGDVRFLLGSTPKMGAGTNVQDLLVGLVHLDAPWRPSDMEQREGRIIRRGNKLYERDPDGFEVEIDRMATRQTLDTRRWQILEHKARGIGQMRCYDGSDSMEDVAAEAANAADMKAAASGNPLILRETQLATEVRRIESLRRAHVDNCASFAQRARHGEYQIQKEIPATIERLSAIRASLTKHDPENPVVTIGGKTHQGAKEVAEAIKNKVEELKKRAISNLMTPMVAEMNVRGFDFKLAVRADSFRGELSVQFTLIGVGGENVRQSRLVGGVSGSHVFADALSNLESISDGISYAKRELEARIQSLPGYKKLAAASFDQEAELQALQAEHGRVRRALIAAQRTEAVDDSELEEFKSALALRRMEIEGAGFGDVLQALDLQTRGLAVPTVGSDAHEEGDSAESMAARPSV